LDPLFVTAGEILTVNMTVGSAAASGTCIDGCLLIDQGSAYVDPIIEIDPDFANASGYSLVFSTGIGNGVTPIPATLPLFATGLGALGVLGWWQEADGAQRGCLAATPR
jgi:hypothetical protein